MHACVYMHVCIYNKCLRMSVCMYVWYACRQAYIYIYMYIYIYGPPPMYPRLSSQSRLWEGMGSWDALVSMPFSEISAAGRRALMGSGACL